MKHYTFTPTLDGEAHEIRLSLNRLIGKATIEIDGTAFSIGVFPLGYLKTQKQLFRVGDKQAILVIQPFRAPDIVIDRKYLSSGEIYH